MDNNKFLEKLAVQNYTTNTEHHKKANAYLEKLAGMSGLAKRVAIGATTGAVGGAVAGGEDHRISGAVGGAAVGGGIGALTGKLKIGVPKKTN